MQELMDLPGYILLRTDLVLGNPRSIRLYASVRKHFRCRQLRINVPCVGFGVVRQLNVNGKNRFIADPLDMFVFAPVAFAPIIDLPALHSGEPIGIEGHYTGWVPEGYRGGEPYGLRIELFEASPIYGGVNVGVPIFRVIQGGKDNGR